MKPTAMVVATLIVLPAVGLMTWAWFSIAQVKQDLRALSGFEGMHLEV